MLRILAADSPPHPRPALFVDRDGVLNRRVVDGYVTSPDAVDLLSPVLDSLRTARQMDAVTVVITNQGAIARGLLTEAELLTVHGTLLGALDRNGVRIDATYICPHHPAASNPDDRSCECRKPEPGLLLAAARDLRLDIGHSVLIGDQDSDVAAGLAAGLPIGRSLRFDAARASDADAADLARSVRRLLAN